MTKKQTIIFIIWILWMALIYWLSAQPDTVSAKQSMEIGELLCSIVVNGFWQMEKLKRLQYIEMIDHVVRKSAHFCEYMILGGLTCLTFQNIGELCKKKNCVDKPEKRKWYALLWCGLYAVTDEIHQLFVPGRFGSILDVLLDLAGAFTGIVAIVWIARWFRKKI